MLMGLEGRKGFLIFFRIGRIERIRSEWVHMDYMDS